MQNDFIGRMVVCIVIVSAISAFSLAPGDMAAVPVENVAISDSFWTPRLQMFRTTTINDVFTKFEGYSGTVSNGNTFNNFDRVAQGLSGGHVGDPWWDGLVYETIRAAGDFLRKTPDAALEARVDGYINRIKAASDHDPNGYLNTAIQLGGVARFSDPFYHEIYNAGCMTEAAVSYYQATGKTTLLYAACRFANYLCSIMGPGIKNYVPEHANAEQAYIRLYQLFKNDTSLKSKLSPLVIDENKYRGLAECWIESRGNYTNRYNNQSLTSPNREYFQDHATYSNQVPCVGHAVRATLFYTGIIDCGRVNGNATYLSSAQAIWDDMANRQMYVTGGLGSSSNGEAFGGDYQLPNNGYCETCASAGGAFFCQRMNMAFADGKYGDALENELYNGALGGISLDGTHYYYNNPLQSTNDSRWAWHACPCCPPMFLKLMSEMPAYIYSHNNDSVYANLFVGSSATINMPGYNITITQKTGYPWSGISTFTMGLPGAKTFGFFVRIPAWSPAAAVSVNGQTATPQVSAGYANITRTWNSGDSVTITLDVSPRRVYADSRVAADVGMVALARGPIVYCLEGMDNHDNANNQVNFTCTLPKSGALSSQYEAALLGGVWTISGAGFYTTTNAGVPVANPMTIKAIPFFARANRTAGQMNVWINEDSVGFPFKPDTIAWYKIINRNSGTAMSTAGNASANGTNIVLGTFSSTNSTQQWRIAGAGSGYFRIINRAGSNALSCQGGGTTNGTLLQLLAYSATTDQNWQIIAVGGGYFKIINRKSGRAASCAGAGTADGTAIHLWDYLGGYPDQDWTFVNVNTTGVQDAEKSQYSPSVKVFVRQTHGGGPTVTFRLPSPALVKIALYDVRGRLLCSFADGMRAGGNYSFHISAKRISCGMAILQVQIDKEAHSELVFIRK